MSAQSVMFAPYLQFPVKKAGPAQSLALLLQKLFFYPIIFAFSFVLAPILALVLIPGGLALLAVIGGQEVRQDMIKAVREYYGR